MLMTHNTNKQKRSFIRLLIEDIQFNFTVRWIFKLLTIYKLPLQRYNMDIFWLNIYCLKFSWHKFLISWFASGDRRICLLLTRLGSLSIVCFQLSFLCTALMKYVMFQGNFYFQMTAHKSISLFFFMIFYSRVTTWSFPAHLEALVLSV